MDSVECFLGVNPCGICVDALIIFRLGAVLMHGWYLCCCLSGSCVVPLVDSCRWCCQHLLFRDETTKEWRHKNICTCSYYVDYVCYIVSGGSTSRCWIIGRSLMMCSYSHVADKLMETEGECEFDVGYSSNSDD